MSQKNLTVMELSKDSGITPPAIYRILAGRTSNPQEGTIKKLETAIGEKLPEHAEEEISKEASVPGLGELTDFDPHDQDELPDVSGVYVFYDISDRPIYVGQGQKMSRRIKEHHEKFWFKKPLVESGSYVEIPDQKLREQVETILIKFLKRNAVLNRQNVDR
jgi:transcriptional regulator with XRE-family HTH domain